jgi:hypothetical protein
MHTIEFEAEIRDGTIHLPEDRQTWSGKPVRVILQEKPETSSAPKSPRRPHPAIAGKGQTIGDLVSPIVDEADGHCAACGRPF